MADDDGLEFLEFAVDPGLLQTGRNVIAVEVHQVGGSSSDISFDAALDLAVQSAPAIPITGPLLLTARVRDAEGNWSARGQADFHRCTGPCFRQQSASHRSAL